MKKYLFIIIIVLGFLVPAWGGQTFTNSDLNKYNRYKSKPSKHRSAVRHDRYPSRSSTRSTTHYPSSRRNRYKKQIRSAQKDLRNVEKQIKTLERKIQFHSKIKGGHNVIPATRAEIKHLHNRSRSIQNNINDLKLLQAGADPGQVMSDRQSTRNAERSNEEREKRDFSDGANDAMTGLPPKSYSGQYYNGYTSHVTNSVPAPAAEDAKPQPHIINGEWDDQGNHYSSAGGGNAWRSDGTFMQKTGTGYIDTKTGHFIPAH